MGSMVIAECDCGFSKQFSVGGGMMNFHEVCYFPALCSECNSMIEINLFEEGIKCPECKSSKIKPYDDDSLQGEKGEHTVVEWNVEDSLGRELILTSGTYLCPKCNNFSLRFGSCGYWD